LLPQIVSIHSDEQGESPGFRAFGLSGPLRPFGDHPGRSYPEPGSHHSDEATNRPKFSSLKCLFDPGPWVQIEIEAYWWLVGASEKVRAGLG
jgi:hypothetical protein